MVNENIRRSLLTQKVGIKRTTKGISNSSRILKYFKGILASLVLITLFACGGGSSVSTISLVKPKVSIAWGPRSRAIDGPSSALSAVITLQNASSIGADVSYSVDRSGPVSGSTIVYTGSEDVKVQPITLTVQFYAGAGGIGALVGTASGSATVDANGTVTTSISTVGTINSVDVPGGQTISVGETLSFEFGARDSLNNLIAVSPGSAIWAVTVGADKLSFANGDATGLAIGNATVTATVDGKTSAGAVIAVADPASITVSVSPTTVSVAPNGTQQFTAQVTGTGNTAVTWSVVESDGGSISVGGLYISPATLASFTVKATSVANPSKFGTATVNVETVTVSVSPTTQTLLKQDAFQLTPTVTGTANHAVTWSVVENNGGTVDSSGLYTAPNAEGMFTVRATSQVNPSVHGDAVLTVASFVVLSLNPFGSSDSLAFTSGSTQVGYAYFAGVGHAGIWSSTATSWVDLNPVGATQAFGYGATQGSQVGYSEIGGVAHASLWSGNAASWVDLHPAGSTNSVALAASGLNQVGYSYSGGSTIYASLWSGSAASWVNLNPIGSTNSQAWGFSGTNQVGVAVIGGAHRASLWSGSAASWVDLSPSGSTESHAYGGSVANQVGYAVIGVVAHASLWSGNAASWVDLHPAGSTESYAYGVLNFNQVGYAKVGNEYHASYWSGTATSWVDLNPSGFTLSHARSISNDGVYDYIVGYGTNAAGHSEALLWKVRHTN